MALGVVARAKGMAQIAEQAGLSREQLYRSLSEHGNPTLKTTIAVMKALGIELTARFRPEGACRDKVPEFKKYAAAKIAGDIGNNPDS